MFYLKLSLTGLLLVTFYGLILCTDDNINKQLTAHDNNEQLHKTYQELEKNVTNSRSGRTLMSHIRKPAFTLRRRQPIQIRSKADHFPIRTRVRRVQNGQAQQQNMRHGYESLKNSKYIPSSKVPNLPFPNNGKGSPYRKQLFGGQPNSIHLPALSQKHKHNFKASPAFNGQVVIHAVTQTQKQQPSTAQQDSSYPKYVNPSQQQPPTAVISLQLQPQQQQNQEFTKYPDFKQYPIPDQEKMQQYNDQHEKYLQQQTFLTPKNPIAYYQLQPNQQQHQELSGQSQQPAQHLLYSQQQQPSIPIHESKQMNKINNVAFPAAAAVPPKMYSVYEENDLPELQTNNYQNAEYQRLDKEAEEYLRFMNTDDYFLPKKEPNYKNIDIEADKRQSNVLKAQAQQHLHSLQQSRPQQTAYQPRVYTPSTLSQRPQYSNSLHSDAPEASAYSQGPPVSRLFYQEDPTASASDSASASATVLRTSYQKGYNHNQFVLNSQDNRSGKYSIPATSTTSSIDISTQSPVVYPQLRYSLLNSRTREPLHFEFTERDAMISGHPYTNAPQAHSTYNELTSNGITQIAAKVESSTVSSSKSQKDAEDDPEDGDDTLEAGNDIFGRHPIASSDSKANKVSTTTEGPPNEQKDTEEYCERICAILEDENEEIVCGSDGYMYTSETQMECYASCLHIDITIQGKGSCSKR